MLAYIFVLFAIAIRFVPHPWHFTPLAASLLFFGARAPRRQLWVALLLMVVSDVILTRYYWALRLSWDQAVIWAWYAAMLWLGTSLRQNQKALRVIAAALASSASFFLISNFSVWIAGNMYPRTSAGLAACFAAAVPFFRNTLESDLVFTLVMFATPVALKALANLFEEEGNHTAAA